MHGTLRFVLALMVALSHLGVSVPHFNQGVFAVVIFYILAGMVSYKLITRYYADSALSYYKDRIKRIFPLYLLSLFIAIIVYHFGIHSYFVSKIPTASDWLGNITIIPLSYYMYTGIDKFTLIPPAWSLGVELQFYILVPLLFRYIKFLYATYLLSISLFFAGILGIINTDYFGYRLIVGVIFIFILGSQIIQAKKGNKTAQKVLCLTYLLCIVIFFYICLKPYKAPYNYEVMTSLLFGIPFLYYYRSPFLKSIDKFLGIQSYGVFLLHFPSHWLYRLFYPHQENFLIVLLISFILSVTLNKLLQNYYNFA